jgi:diguanylate cyclase (GGDEF)-like protein/PAS domain S-box-containing protein
MPVVMPSNENERLLALKETGLLDTPPEEGFDSLVRLAAVICDTPVALITLVDRDRQWFKAAVGFAASETQRDIAFCAHTILQPDLFVITDASKDERFRQHPLVTDAPGIRFYAGMPLETEEGLRIGSLCVIDRTPKELDDRQVEALKLLTRQANKQINQRRQQHQMEIGARQSQLIELELRESRELFHAFMDKAPFFASMKDSEGRMIYYNQRMAKHFDVDREAWLGKTDDELWPTETAAKLRANDHSVLREWKTTIIEEQVDPPAGGVPEYWRSYKFPFRDTQGREYVAGVAVDVTSDKEAERRIASYQAALEQANERLLKLSVTDGLTNLLNRRAFDAALEREFAISARYGTPLSCLIADIDGFKLFNDTFGHEVGDGVLQSVAAAMVKCFRATDVVARYGGEEFAVLLLNTARGAAAESAERLRRFMHGIQAEARTITISIGISAVSMPDTKAALLRRADEALYRAKRQGKDQVCLG